MCVQTTLKRSPSVATRIHKHFSTCKTWNAHCQKNIGAQVGKKCSNAAYSAGNRVNSCGITNNIAVCNTEEQLSKETNECICDIYCQLALGNFMCRFSRCFSTPRKFAYFAAQAVNNWEEHHCSYSESNYQKKQTIYYVVIHISRYVWCSQRPVYIQLCILYIHGMQWLQQPTVRYGMIWRIISRLYSSQTWQSSCNPLCS